MSVGHQQVADAVVCHCYEVTESQILRMIDTDGAGTVEEVTSRTCAGSGCTACHWRIRRMLAGLPATCPTDEVCVNCGFESGGCACNLA
jgi:NAD(P)H-nitrite reductase large subunit